MLLRRSAWSGMRPRLPRLRLAAIGGASPTHMSRRAAQALDVGVHRLLALGVRQPLDELVATLNEFRPDHLNGYPSIMGPLAEEKLAGRLAVEPKSVFTNSEPLSPGLRARIEQAFGVRPYNFYATTEGSTGTTALRARCTCSTTCASSRTSTRRAGR